MVEDQCWNLRWFRSSAGGHIVQATKLLTPTYIGRTEKCLCPINLASYCNIVRSFW
ncbi:hypothetical protein AAZX31_05G220000 [Glycine max]